MNYHDGFSVNADSFSWGITFEQAQQRLFSQEQFKPHPGNRPTLRIKGTNIFDLRCTEINLRAPFTDGPVLQTQYDLSPLPAVSAEDLHSAYVAILESNLGPVIHKGNYYNSDVYKGSPPSYCVVFTCNWDTADVHIGISVYGGTRNAESGDYGASLYIYWKNLPAAAKFILQQSEEFLSKLHPFLSEVQLHRVRPAYPQFPFIDFGNAKTDVRKPEYEPHWRNAYIALYTRGSFATPEELSANMNDHDVIVFKVSELQCTFIANKWDMTFLRDFDSVKPEFVNVLPARGSGGREFHLKGFKARDSRESNELLNLVQWVERLSGVQATVNEWPDD